MQVEIIACLADNYAYVVTCEATGHSVIIDASEASPVLAQVARRARRVDAIWSTHHHYDHIGGNDAVAAALGVRECVAHASDRARIPSQTRGVSHGETWRLGALQVRVLHVPGHTLGAVAYVVTSASEQAVFTGDTLFVAGCGRLFEGTAAMMFDSLESLAKLGAHTKIYCGHEYTEANLRFATHLEPDNRAIANALVAASACRAAGRPTVPSRVADELACNPFVRARDAEELGARRTAKDSFK